MEIRFSGEYTEEDCRRIYLRTWGVPGVIMTAVALFTTVGGLSVAIPALFILYASNLRLSSVVSECESLSEQFVHEIAQIKRRDQAGGNHPQAAEPQDKSQVKP